MSPVLRCTRLVVLTSYCLAAYWLNSSVIDVTKGRILVYANPLPFPHPRKRSVNSSELEQLFVEEFTSGGGGEGGPSHEYHLRVLLRYGKKVSLFRSIRQDPWVAWEIEERIEDFLEIEDIYVEGEHV